jgi:enoyl-[acyl-carrier protein] reductase I
MSVFAGKVALVVGVANKRSLAWAIARALHAGGATLVLTYQNDRLRENVEELAVTLTPAPALLPCDVADDGHIAALFEAVARDHGGLDVLVHGAAFAPREALSAPFVRTSREAFRIAMDVSAYSLVALANGAAPLMAARGGGSILTLTYLGASRVFPNYNVMGVAKAALEASVRYLAADLGPQNVRVNAISAGPVKTLAAAGISGFSSILGVYRDRAPLRRNIDAEEVADTAAFLLGPGGRGITGEVVMVDAGFSVVGM